MVNITSTQVLVFLLAVTVTCTSAVYRHHRRHPSNNQPTTPIPANFTLTWYNQKVDHFSYANNDRFPQRVITSTDHWNCDGCPIFFYCGNEGDIFVFANNTGWLWEKAPTFRAMVVFVEHRYYGESQPYGNQSYESLDKLGYLSSEQALADYAEYITHIKQTVPGAKNSPVIAFGGSYGGMLASWFRIKYPHLVEGALAASAPILQFTGIYDCNGYFDIVTKDFTQYSTNCSQSIKNSWAAARRLAATDGGKSWLQSTFNICEDLNVEGNLDKFITWLSGAYESLAMTDYPNAATFLQPLPAYPMKETCKRLTNPNQDDKPLLLDIFNAVSVFYNYSGWNSNCNTIEDDDMATGWSFQFCTEMLLPVCSNGVTDMFENNPWNVTSVTQDCLKNWKVSPELYKAEIMYGGKNISTASNIIFSNGERDPWSAGGVLEQLSPFINVITVPNACHHEDLRPTGPNDPASLTSVRGEEVQIIMRWLVEYYEKIGHHPEEWMNVMGNK